MKKNHPTCIILHFLAFLLFVLCATLEANAQKRIRRNRKAPSPQITIVQAMASMDELTKKLLEEQPALVDSLLSDTTANMNAGFITAKHTIQYPEGIDSVALSLAQRERIIRHVDTNQPDSLLHACQQILLLSNNENLPLALEGMAQVYAMHGDTYRLRLVMNYYEKYNMTLPNNPYSDIISDLLKEYDDILNPVPFTKKVEGYWVSSRGTDTMPYITFRIHSLTHANGIQLMNQPGWDRWNFDKDLSMLQHSQHIGGKDGCFEAAFGSEHLKQGSSSFAESGFEATRQFRASMAGNIAASKAGFGDKIAASTLTSLTAGLLDAFFSSSAKSSKEVAALNLNLSLHTPNLLSGYYEYWNYSVSTSNPSSIYNNPRPNAMGDIEFVRWEPSDSIYFVDTYDKSHKIMSVGPVSKDFQSRYDEIAKKYSWKRPKYLVPIILSEVAGAALLSTGVVICCGDMNVYDKNGNIQYDKNGNKKINMGKLTGGVITAVVGYIGMLVPPLTIYTSRIRNRSAAYNEINGQQMKKIKEKARLNMLPEVDSDNTIAVNFNMEF